MNKEKVIRNAINDLLIGGKDDVIEEVFSSDYLAHAGSKEYRGRDFIKRWAGQMHTAFVDITIEEISILSESEDRISWQRTLTGTHGKSLLGIPPSNKKVTWTEMLVSRFENEKIVEEWVVSELAGQLMLKLGKQG